MCAKIWENWGSRAETRTVRVWSGSWGHSEGTRAGSCSGAHLGVHALMPVLRDRNGENFKKMSAEKTKVRIRRAAPPEGPPRGVHASPGFHDSLVEGQGHMLEWLFQSSAVICTVIMTKKRGASKSALEFFNLFSSSDCRIHGGLKCLQKPEFGR